MMRRVRRFFGVCYEGLSFFYGHRWMPLCMILMGIVFLVMGCKPLEISSVAHDRIIVDSTGTSVGIPRHPNRVISVGVSTDDILIELIGAERIIGIGRYPNNHPEESKKIPHRITAGAEAVLSLNSDLLVVPDWINYDTITEIRALGIPVYVYRTPKKIDDIPPLLEELGNVVGEEEKGLRMANEFRSKLYQLEAFTESKERKMVAYYSKQGLMGGKGSLFDSICNHLHLLNAAALVGLDQYEYGGRESVIAINPDVFIVTQEVTADPSKMTGEIINLYEDPALSHVKGIENKAAYQVDSRWILSYSPFILKGMEQIAYDVYGKE